MADIFSGYKRSLTVYATKKLDGVTADGYPKSYPTTSDISNGYFTYNSVQYAIPTPTELSTMSQAAYDSLLAIFKLYVESIEAGASFATDTIVEATFYDPSGCPVNIPTTTTTTTTIVEPDPDATYAITSNGYGYSSTQTIFTVTGAKVGDIVTVLFTFTGSSALNLASGYSSTIARLFAAYPGGTVQALNECFSGPGFYDISITKSVSFVAPATSFTITTEISKVNTLNPIGEFFCTITNVKRGVTDHPMSKVHAGKFYKVMESQFSC